MPNQKLELALRIYIKDFLQDAVLENCKTYYNEVLILKGSATLTVIDYENRFAVSAMAVIDSTLEDFKSVANVLGHMDWQIRPNESESELAERIERVIAPQRRMLANYPN